MPDVPSGIVTICFTDIEGSTKLLRELGDRYDEVLDRHYAILRAAFARAGGHEIRSEGDSVLVVFQDAARAINGVADAMRTLDETEWGGGVDLRVRAGLHTGEVRVVDGDLRGLAVHQAARIMACAHGGQVVCSDDTAGAASALDDVLLEDLGVHRVRDFDEPQHLYQVVGRGLRSAFRPLRAAVSARNPLPQSRTSFVGRQRELDDAAKLAETAPVLCIVGPGGVGKTRLGVELARLIGLDRDAGAVAVLLADLDDADQVASQVASALGVRAQPGVAVTDSIVTALSERDTVVLLDNCEHVLLACAQLVAAVAIGAPAVTVVATSRRPLGVDGEAVYRLAPMELPSGGAPLDELALVESVALFVDRALRARPTFELTDRNAAAVIGICQRVDGLPLAIELAASRVRSVPLDAIADRLDRALDVLQGPEGALDRHRTLRTVIDWSYELLTPIDQAAFRRMSVFRGGFDLDAAEAVCVVVDGEHAIDVLGRLIEHSMVAFDGERYSLLAVMAEYAAEALAGAGPDDSQARDRHLKHYAAIAAAASSGLESRSQLRWVSVIDAELDNMRVALAWGLEGGGSGSVGAELAADLSSFWLRRLLVDEGTRWIDAALAVAPEATPVRLLLARGRFAYAAGDFVASGKWAAEALPLAEASGDLVALSRACIQSGNAMFATGDAAGARSWFDRALIAARASGDAFITCACLLSASNTARIQAQLDSAAAMASEGLELARQAGDTTSIGRFLVNLGVIANRAGDVRAAGARFEEALVVLEESGDDGTVMLCLANLGDVARQRGQMDEATSLVERALAMAQTAGDRAYIGAFIDKLGEIALAGDDPARAVARFEQGVAAARRVGDRRGLSRRLLRLGNALSRLGDAVAAVDRTTESLALAGELGDEPQVVLSATANLANMALERGDLDAAGDLYASAFGMATATGDRVAAGRYRIGMARVALGRDAAEQARALAEEAAVLGGSAEDPMVVAHARAVGAAALGQLGADLDAARASASLATTATRGLSAIDAAVVMSEIVAVLAHLDPAVAVEAAEAARAELARQRVTLNHPAAERVVATIDGLRSRMGDRAFAAAVERGQQRSPHEAIDACRVVLG